jgi:hypothetical protein
LVVRFQSPEYKVVNPKKKAPEPIEVGGGGGGEVDNSQAISGAVGSLNICVAAGICYMSYSRFL